MLTMELPKPLQQEFEQTVQQKFYDHDGMKRAVIEAIELWLATQRQHRIKAEAKTNNQAFENIKAQLERDCFGKWVVIAHGKLQGIGDSLKEVNQLAPEAPDRIVMQVGEHQPKEVDLGWQIAFD
ncbi:hypothetical protein PN36_01155 [Candidatus Thiomargarita nelsonii]|uniref:DUF5678 domain-containing protein n=1 Tax=Candidatus Thiomargarita nelsonii TaxID=1003181 RepID=A0A4E0RLD6_9GAMM|nr:hypothetical protein PN36_01155 [Candidatus Thiomargarita nelsonii]